MWIFFALTSVLTDSFSNLFRRLLMKNDKSDPYTSAILFQFLLAAATWLFAWSKGMLFITPKTFLWPNIILSSMLYATGTLLNFKAYKKIGASEVTILGAFGSVVSIILAVFFLRESFGIFKLIGTLLILISVIILYWGNAFKINKGIWYAVGMAACFGAAIVNDTFVLKSYSAIPYVPIISFLPGLFLLIAKPQSLNNISSALKNKRLLWPLILLCSVYSIQAITYFLALEKGAQASQMGPISKSAIIITVLLATIFLKERKNLLKKIISTGLVMIGVLLLIK